MSSEIFINTILEDGVSEFKTIASLLKDITSENDILGAVLTANNSKVSQGNWEYSLDGGNKWGVLPTNFSEDNSQGLVLSSDTLIRFIPAKDFFGTPGSLSLKPFDNENLTPISDNVPYGDQEGFIVSWQSNRQESDDYNDGIFLQRFNSDGSKLGSEIQVNTYIENNQQNSKQVALNNGSFVVTWQSNGQDDSSWGIYGQIFDKNGNKKGSEFLVNTTTDDEQRNPSIAASSDGSFIIVWQSRENYNWKAKGQKYKKDGSPDGDEFSIVSQQYDSFEDLSTTALSNGNYVIAFRHHSNIKFQIIKTDSKVDEFSVYNETIEQVNKNTDSKSQPVVSPLNDGGFVISWSSYRQDGDQWGVFARTYNSEGIASSEEFQVNTTTTDRQQNSSVAGLVDGGFVISWQSHNQDGNGDGVYAQRFDEKGDMVGGEFLVNTSTNSTQSEPSVAALKNGGYIIAWNSWEGIDGWSSGVYGQKYKKDGSRDGDEFLINTFTERDQRYPSISPWGLPLPEVSQADLGTNFDLVNVSLEISSVNDAPSLTGDSKSISDSNKNSTTIISSDDLLKNYSDVDGDTLSVSEVNLIDGGAGSLVDNGDKTWTFTPAKDYVGTVDISFAVSDGTVSIQANEAFNVGEGLGGEGTSGNDNLIGKLLNDTIDGGEGEDIIDGMDGDDTLSGGAGSDIIRGGLGNDSILGGDDSDLLYGSNGNDNIQGDGGEDQLYGGGGNDNLQGGGGDDIATGDSGSDALRGGGGSDQILGGDGDDLIFGEDGDDIIKGGEGDDLIFGGSGTDDLRGAEGNDIFLEIGKTVSDDVYDGGSGTDTIYVGSHSDWNKRGGPNFVDAAILNIEHLNLLPTAEARADRFDPTISDWDRENWSKNGARFSIIQLDKFLSIKSSSVLSWTNDLFSFKSTDRDYVGYSNNEDTISKWRWLRISGDGKVDLNDPKWDKETLFRITTESGSQDLIGGDNQNWFFAGEGDDKLFGNGGNDTLLGGKGKDEIKGGKGNDHIEGNEGVDTLYGGDGNDVIIGGGSSDKVYGESGNDSVEINFGEIDGHRYNYDNSKSISGIYDGGEGVDKLRIQAESWYGNDEGTRGEGYTIDLRNADITNFEKLEIGTAAILRLKGSQYSQFTSGISKVSGYEGSTNLAIDLNQGEELRFSRSAGINSASGALNITGTSEVFSDVLGINSDSLVDLSNEDTKIVGVESLEVQRGNVKLNGSQWNTFNTIKAKGDKVKKLIVENTSDIDLTKFGRSSDDNTTIDISLTVDQINSDAFDIFSNKFNTVNNSKVDIKVLGNGVINKQDWPLSINFDEGDATFATLSVTGDESDETFNLRLLGSFTLDGGLGNDKLVLKANSSLDKGSISNVEILDLNNNNVSLSSSQFNSFSEIVGSGNITIKDSNRINLDILKPSTVIRLIQDSEDLVEPVKYYVGTSNNENIEADNFIELLKGSIRVSGNETISTPDRKWIYPEELDNIGHFHPSGEGRLSFSANDQRLFKLPSDFTGEDSIDLVNTKGLEKVNNYTTAYTGDKFLGVNRETGNWKIISFDEISWEEEGSASNQVSLSYWDVKIKDSSDIIYGLEGADTLKGGGGNDQLSGGGGNDRIEGGSGFNTAIFSDIQSQYKITYEGREITIEHLNGGSDGKDVLVDIQKLKFADSDFNIDDVTNTFDSLNGVNSKLGKTNRGVIDYNTSNNVWTSDQDWDNWSFELIAGSKIKVFKTVYDGSPTVGNTAPQVRFDGDLSMYQYYDEKEFDISRTGIHKIRVLGTESVEYGVSTRMIDEKPGDTTTTAQFKEPSSLAKGEDPSLANSIEGFIGYQIDGNGGIPEWETKDIDWIRVDLVKGIQYEFKALGASSLPATGLEDTHLQRLSDPAISLLDEEGQKITEGELGGSGQDPLMVYRADRSGAYFVAVESASGEFTGNYQVTKSSLDEFGGDINTNGQLSLSRPIQGVINTEGDQDWFKVNLTTGERLVIEVLGGSTNNGDLRDPWLGVYSQTGQLLVSDNNSGRGLDSRISWAAPADGNYFVAAGSLGNQGRGSYIVRASSKQDDAPDQLSSSFTYNLVSIGTDATGDIEVRGDHDWFQTLLLAGKTYQISVKGERSFDSTYDPLRDPAVSLRDNAGKLILFDDDSGSGLSSEIIYQPKRTGRFYLDIQDATDRYDGHYKISVSEAVDDFGNDIKSAHIIEDSNDFSSTGRLNYRGDLDLFKADLLEDTVYKIDLKGISSDSGTLGDPLLNILNSQGLSIAQNDNSGVGNDSEYFFISESNQTIYLEATAPAGQLGTYSLTLEKTELPKDDHGNDKNTTSLISIGENVTGNILNAEDTDWFKISLDADLHYRFVLEGADTGSGTLNNPYIKVHDESGNFIAGSDSGTLTRNVALGFKPDSKGTYFISASGASSEDTGTYTLKTFAPDEAGVGVDNAMSINIDTTTSAGIQSPTDSDWFHFSAEEGKTYTLAVVSDTSSETSGLPIAITELFDSTKTPITAADGRFTDGNATLAFKAESDGDYYLAARGYRGQTGNYQLTLSEGNQADDAGLIPSKSRVLSVNEQETGVLEVTGDRDLFSIDVLENHTYRFRLSPEYNGIQAPLIDPRLRLLGDTQTFIKAAGYDFIANSITVKKDSIEVSNNTEVPNPYQNPYQSIIVQDSTITTSSEGNVKVPLKYDISDKNSSVTGLGLQIHYNSNAISPIGETSSGLTGLFTTNIFGNPSIIDDINNLDSDDTTDKIIQVNWADLSGNWPSTDLPLEIGNLNFTRVDDSIESNINFTALESEIDSNDNREIKTGIDFSSEIIYTAKNDGTLYLEAGGSEDKWQGIYNILASDLGNLATDDHPSTLEGDADPLVIIAGQQRTGVIETTDDLDLFTLNLKGLQNYQISVRGEVGNGGSLPDPRFRLLNKDGNAVAAAFDGIANPDASLNIKVLEDGKYYLEVSADRTENENSALDFGDAIDVSSTNIGSYTAELTEVIKSSEDDQVESNTNTNEKLLLGESFVGKLVEADDVDWVSVDLTEGELYIFDAKPRIVNKIGAWNPALELINSDGNRIDLDLDSGEGDAARITYRASSTGTFYLSTRSQDGTYGTYELSKKLLESGSTDPYEIYQWHLSNKNGLDLNIQSVWKDVSGEGVLVGVIDDGINYKHPDLNDNLDFIRDKGESWNCITGMGVVYQDANLRVAPKPERGHGTAVAGVIAAEKNNQAGVVGVAYDSKVAGFEVDWSTKSIASMLRSQVRLDIGGMDVTNNSWGFTSLFGDDFDSPLMEPLGESLEYGVDEGRYLEEVNSSGETVGTYYGLNWVFAAGNSRSKGDNTNYHNFQNSRYVTTVAATNSQGETSRFSTPGASILVSAFGEGVYTTCLNCAGPNDPNGYGNFSGTSAAAPIVSGVIALMLEANKKLGYRDVQNILAYSARQEISEGFKFNGAKNWNGGGLHISHDQGFGLVDAHAAVRLAESWDRPAQVAANEQVVVRRLNNSSAIPDNDESGISFSTSIERDLDVEWAEVELDIRHERIADLVVELVSPSGTVSRLIDRPTSAPSNPEGIYGPYSGMPDRIIFTTSSSLFRGESSLGNWTLRVSDQNAELSGELRQWGVKLYGKEASNDDIYIFTDEYQKVADANRSALYDAEGQDCINAAAVTSACFIDLNDGAASQIGLSEFLIADNVLIEDVFTGDGNDFITGNEKNNTLNSGRGNDRFIASGGDDYIDGGFGYDEIIYDANYADFELLQVGNLWNLIDKRSTDIDLHYGQETFKSIEKLVFNDQDFLLEITNSAPVLANPIPDLSYGADVLFDYSFNNGIFTDADVDNGSGDSLGYTLKMADGKDLPGWLSFDRNQIKLSGEPYPAISGEYNLELKATDIFGASASDQFSLTIAGTSSDTSEPDAEKRVEWDLEVINQEEAAQKVVNVGDSFEISIKASDISDVNPHSVFSAYTDLHYDHTLIKAVSISYDDNFSQINSGNIDNSQGLIADLGANLSSFQSVPDPSMLTVTFDVLRPGVGDISLRPNQSEYLETTIFGFDGDQRAYSTYKTQSITFNAPDPDIAVSSFDIKNNKIASGLANISYKLSNFGQVDSKEFNLKIYHSDDNELDKDNDLQIFSKLFKDGDIVGEGATDVITGELQVPVDELYKNAKAEDAIGPELGKTSSSKDWLFMDIEPLTEQADSILSNNTKSLEVTYFPWDIDGNGRVTSVDAITMVNNIGDAPLVNGVSSIYDLNGDGTVDQIEVMDIVQRIGLQVNNDVNAIA